MNSAVANPAGRPPLGAAPSPTFSPLYQQIKSLILQSLLALEWKPGEGVRHYPASNSVRVPKR